MSALQSQNAQSNSDAKGVSVSTDLPLLLPGTEVEESGPKWGGANLLAWLRTGTGMFSGLVTLLAATLTVLFLLVPSIKPGASGNVFSATMSDAGVETDVALASYYDRLDEIPSSTLSGSDLVQRGTVVSFTVIIEGFKGKECRLIWSVFDASTNKRAGQNWLVEQPGWPVGIFVPEANVDQGNGEIFVPNPPVAGTYFVRLELNNPDGERLTTIDSPVFSVAGATGAPAPVVVPTEPEA